MIASLKLYDSLYYIINIILNWSKFEISSKICTSRSTCVFERYNINNMIEGRDVLATIQQLHRISIVLSKINTE